MSGRIQVYDSGLLSSQNGSLEKWRKETAAPIGWSVDGQAARIRQDDIGRQFLRFAAETIHHPRAYRRAAGNAGYAALKMADARLVAIDAGVHRSNHTNIVDHAGEMRQ